MIYLRIILPMNGGMIFIDIQYIVFYYIGFPHIMLVHQNHPEVLIESPSGFPYKMRMIASLI